MNNSFGEFLKQKRQEKGLTQKDLAKALYVSESAVSKWEKNVAHPDITLLPKLSEFLEVTEHELITASVDKQLKQEKVQAKKWRTLSLSWSLFFYISYFVAVLTCFICNLAVSGKLSWFWIVLSALLFAFTFTNLPKLIKKHKLIFIPLSMYLSLCLLLAVCCIFDGGNWFWIPSISVLLGLVIIFCPIYISKYEIFSKIKKHNDFVSIFIDYVMLNILLMVIYFTNSNKSAGNWYLKIALPITLVIYIILNILICVKFLKINKPLKSSIILFLIDLFLYLPPLFINVKSSSVQKEIDSANILKANFLNWKSDVSLENNIHCIIFLTIIILAVIFFVFGLGRQLKTKKSKHTINK